jgi:hypothetical protein
MLMVSFPLLVAGSGCGAAAGAAACNTNLLLPKTSSILVGADAWVRPMLRAMAAGGALVLQGNAVAW